MSGELSQPFADGLGPQNVEHIEDVADPVDNVNAALNSALVIIIAARAKFQRGKQIDTFGMELAKGLLTPAEARLPIVQQNRIIERRLSTSLQALGDREPEF